MDTFSQCDEVPTLREDSLHRTGARRAKPKRTPDVIEAAIAGFRGKGGKIVKVSASDRPPEQEPMFRTRDLTPAIRLLLEKALKIEEGAEFDHETLGRVRIHLKSRDGRVILQRMDTGEIRSGWVSTLSLVVNGRRVADIIGWGEGEQCKITLASARERLIAEGLLESEVSEGL